MVDGEKPERAQHPEAQGERRRRGSPGLRALQGHLHSVPLGLRKSGQRGAGHGLEETRQPRERELRLGLDRPAREHEEAVHRGRASARVPQGGLPDAGGALEHQYRGAPAHVVREPGQLAPLSFAADKKALFGGAGHGKPSLT